MKITAYVLDRDEETGAIAQLANQYSEGDNVRYGDGDLEIGVVTDIYENDISWPERDEDISGSASSPIYIVSVAEGGSRPFKASDIAMAGSDVFKPEGEADVEDPVESAKDESEELAAEMEEFSDVEELTSIPGVDDPGVGWDDYPDSWEDAERPARIIFLDMWSSVGASFTGAKQEFGSDRMAASTKDTALGTEQWRSWSD